MRAVVQRVRRAAVTVAGDQVGSIDHGLCALVAATHDDTEARAVRLADRLVKLRVFTDDGGRMNRSVQDVAGSILVVSQFTLYADTRKGNRPGYSDAAPPEVAEPLIESVVARIAAIGVPVATGRFRADMDVELVNQGPVTVILDIDTP
jgi:D-tyrosyl-tRNA(Tyr) deacylase